MPSYHEAQLPAAGTTYLALARDPLARYLSAYKSKLACVNEGVDLRDRTPFVTELVARAADSGLSITPHRANASNAEHGGPCLSFQQYTIALSAIHRAGNGKDLNGHFRPQDIVLAPCAQGLLTVASEMQLLAPVLRRSYELHPNATMDHDHSTGDVLPEIDAQSVQRLCVVARREMRWLGKGGVALPEAGEPLSVANCSG